jgi:hypothetical protein
MASSYLGNRILNPAKAGLSAVKAAVGNPEEEVSDANDPVYKKFLPDIEESGLNDQPDFSEYTSSADSSSGEVYNSNDGYNSNTGYDAGSEEINLGSGEINDVSDISDVISKYSPVDIASNYNSSSGSGSIDFSKPVSTANPETNPITNSGFVVKALGLENKFLPARQSGYNR